MSVENTKYAVSDGTDLSDAEIARLDAIEAAVGPDTASPVWSAEDWRKAVRSPFHKAVKEPVSIRIDKDILAWLRSQGPGYQTEINRILREHMLAQLRPTT